MLYFTNTELASKYHVSLGTVKNWIDAAKEGKISIDLTAHDKRTYVANTTRNISLITELTNTRRKYRNSKSVKQITPKLEFYKVFNEHQIHDIATNLEIHHEIPRQYNYMNGGAIYWDQYATRLANEDESNVINSTIKLLNASHHYLDGLLSRYQKVNVIDIGVGNALPTKDLLAHLIEQNKLGRYIAFDISPDILKIAKENIDTWFKGQVKFEGYQRDINYDRFSDILLKDYAHEGTHRTVNVVLLLGGTLANFRKPEGAFRIIHDSMGIHDLLIHTKKLDTQATRQYFDFNIKPGAASLPETHKVVADLLNIDELYYDIELGYDPESHQRYERLRLKVSLVFSFKFSSGVHKVEFTKGSSILIWRAHQQTAADVYDQFDRNDFYILHASQTDDREYILTVSGVKRS